MTFWQAYRVLGWGVLKCLAFVGLSAGTGVLIGSTLDRPWLTILLVVLVAAGYLAVAARRLQDHPPPETVHLTPSQQRIMHRAARRSFRMIP